MTLPYKNSGFAGEMLVAAELSRLGYEVLLGNVGTKKTIGIDLAAVNPETGKTLSISVKSLKSINDFIIDPEKVCPDSIYVFVITNSVGEKPEFFVARGSILLAQEEHLWGKWGRSYHPAGRRSITAKKLESWRGKWEDLEKEK